MDIIQIVSVSLGTFFILLLLFLVFWRRNLTAIEYTFSRIVLALAVACVAILLTGFLKIAFKGTIQAGGAFAVFVIVYCLAPVALQGSSEWNQILEMWRNLRDIDTAKSKVNNDDLVKAINAINDTAVKIENNDSLYRPFKKDLKNDFCLLYSKLAKNDYSMAWINSYSGKELNSSSKKLAGKLECKQ